MHLWLNWLWLKIKILDAPSPPPDPDPWVDVYPQGCRTQVQQNSQTGAFRYRILISPLGDFMIGDWLPGDPYGRMEKANSEKIYNSTQHTVLSDGEK